MPYSEQDREVVGKALDAIEDHLKFAKDCWDENQFASMLISMMDLVDMVEGVAGLMLRDEHVEHSMAIMVALGAHTCDEAHAHREEGWAVVPSEDS